MLDQSLQIADAVARERAVRRVGKGTHEDFIKDRVSPPVGRLGRRAGRHRHEENGGAPRPTELLNEVHLRMTGDCTYPPPGTPPVKGRGQDYS